MSGSNGHQRSNGHSHTVAAERDPRAEARALERKADAIRRDVDLLIAEADRRRHKLTGVTDRLRAHPAVALGLACAAGVAAATLSYLAAQHYRRRQTLAARVSDVGAALARALRKPERVARGNGSVPARIVAAAGAAAASSLARRGVGRLFSS